MFGRTLDSFDNLIVIVRTLISNLKVYDFKEKSINQKSKSPKLANIVKYLFTLATCA
jgi:hypothetical protein